MAQAWGAYASLINVNELTEFCRHQAQDLQGFDQLCNAPTGAAMGRNKGDTVQYTYFPNITNTGGALDENEEIPEGSITPVKGTYVISEFGNSIKWTGKLEELSRLDVNSDFMKALTDDMKKLGNSQAFAQFDASSWIATFNSTADEFRTDGVAASFTNVANQDLDLSNLRFLRKTAEKRLIPTFDGESYAVVTGVDSADNLTSDSAVTGMLSYDSGRAALNQEVGRIAGCRILKDTHKIAKVGGSSSGAGLNLDKTYLVGADAVIKEYALAPEIRAQDKDFGRSVAIAYYFMGVWKKIYDQTNHSKEHVIRVLSK